tara:strand:- start:370 stop:927 length:558 start_codon:yes stop_codon:yes gene_type:complete
MNGLEVYSNILSKESCKEIIKFFKKDRRHKLGFTSGGINTKTKQSTDLYCTFSDNQWDSYSKLIEPSVVKFANNIKEKYPFLNTGTDYWRNSNSYNIQYYKDNQGYFTLHCEQSSTCPHRMLAWMIYLNDAKCGTEFPYQKTILSAERGKGAIWPATWTHPHKGVTPNIGNKYIVTGWFEFYKPQ